MRGAVECCFPRGDIFLGLYAFTAVWNRKLPVRGIYGRHIRTMRVDGVTFNTTDAQDARPVILADDVRELRVENLHHSPLPPGTQMNRAVGGLARLFQ